MVNYVDKALFNNDSLDKQIHIVSSDSTVNLGNNDLISESFRLEESLCSGENLMFGAVEPRCVKFTVKYSAPKLMNKWLTITMTLHGSQTPFEFGDYQVLSDKPSSDRTTREVTAYSHFHKILKNTYKNWYKNAWGSSDSMTIKDLRDSFFARLQETHSWVVQETTSLVNDNVVIKKSKKIPRISGKDILNAICEINGVFGYIDRDSVFRYKTLSNSNTTYDIGKTYTISSEYEDYSTIAVDRVEILSQNGDILGEAGVSDSNSNNKYVVSNNFMLKGLGSGDVAKDTAQLLASHLLNVIKTVTYTPFDADFKGNPCFEVGDRISFTSHGTTITSYILQRKMSGIQSLRDNFMADGEENNEGGYSSTGGGTASVFSNKIQSLQEQLGDIPISDFSIVQDDTDNSLIFQSVEAIESGLHQRSFLIWTYNPNISETIKWTVWRLTVTMPSYFDVCTTLDWAGDYYTVDGASRQRYNIVFVIKPGYAPTRAQFDYSYEWVKGVSVPGWTTPSFTVDGNDTPRSRNGYYYMGSAFGTIAYGFMDDNIIDYMYNSFDDLYSAFNTSAIVIPDVPPEAETKLPTESTSKQAAANAEYLAEKLAGNSPSRSSETYDGFVNVMSEESMGRLSNALYSMGENIGNVTSEMTGATAQEDGAKGLVPKPLAGDNEKYLRGDGTWQTVQGGGGSAEMLAPTPFIYSESEEQVGIWTDGKPLYAKTIIKNNIDMGNANGTKTQIAHGITNFGDLAMLRLDCPVLGVSSGDTLHDGNTGAVLAAFRVNATNVYCIAGTGWYSGAANRYWYITLQYTKTTDTPWQGGFKAYGFTPVIYSETEREIGVWSDGKPLYEKTIKSTITPSANAWNQISLPENISVKTYCGYYRRSTGAVNKFSAYREDSNPAEMLFDSITNSTYYYRISSAFIANFSEIDVIIQYTKTTDVAGSGHYAALGVPAVHYSENEQVIGTWIDGKTLYQKTINFGGLPNNTTKVVAHSINNLGRIVKLFGTVYSTENGYTLPLEDTDGAIGITGVIRLFANNTNVYIVTYRDQTPYDSTYITIQYTKTS